MQQLGVPGVWPVVRGDTCTVYPMHAAGCCAGAAQVLRRIRGFAAMNKLKKEALKVIASNLPAEEITGLKEMFEAMDKDGRCVTHMLASTLALQSHHNTVELEAAPQGVTVTDKGCICATSVLQR